MFPKLELLTSRPPEVSLNGSEVGEEEKNSCRSPLLARRDIRGMDVAFSVPTSDRFALLPSNELESKLLRLLLVPNVVPLLCGRAIKLLPLALRTRLPLVRSDEVVAVAKLAVLALVVTALLKPKESPLDARIVLNMPPPGDGVKRSETGGGGSTVAGFLIGLPSRSLSLKYLAKLLRDSARAGSLSEASLLALSRTLARTCPTESCEEEFSEVVFRSDAKMLPA